MQYTVSVQSESVYTERCGMFSKIKKTSYYDMNAREAAIVDNILDRHVGAASISDIEDAGYECVYDSNGNAVGFKDRFSNGCEFPRIL